MFGPTDEGKPLAASGTLAATIPSNFGKNLDTRKVSNFSCYNKFPHRLRVRFPSNNDGRKQLAASRAWPLVGMGQLLLRC